MNAKSFILPEKYKEYMKSEPQYTHGMDDITRFHSWENYFTPE